eukprot:CAMPEP_0172601920 /NCGR_PEP_ID=MMETSP1068-20121228/22090_1 /TAXON_ID=35684 /ORGANISM="Pseudopedinella elastica, Strain CCMP716" /LENGTH=356 /DNA_ID=CAMNT_0013403101 /DNA_START=153 /DNA_END=1220 /DNA_ORIENTATION=+
MISLHRGGTSIRGVVLLLPRFLFWAQVGISTHFDQRKEGKPFKKPHWDIVKRSNDLRSPEWGRHSLVRTRSGACYDNEDGGLGPVLDMWKVAVANKSVHVFAADRGSLEAVKSSAHRLTAEALRTSEIEPVDIIVHKEPMPHGFCDPTIAGNAALYFLKPSFWFNTYKLFDDAAMLLYHIAKTPDLNSVHERAFKPKLLIFGDPTLGESGEVFTLGQFRAKNNWARLLFGPASLPGGRSSAEGFLGAAERPLCVGSLHWGQPVRPLSAQHVPQAQRRAAISRLKLSLQRACQHEYPNLFSENQAKYSRAEPSSVPKVLFISRPVDMTRKQGMRDRHLNSEAEKLLESALLSHGNNW